MTPPSPYVTSHRKDRDRRAYPRVLRSMAYRITPATLEILELLARYRYLRKSFWDGLLLHRSRQSMNRTLQRMAKAGLIVRPPSQFRGYNSLYCCYVYEITPCGWGLLRDREIAHVANLIRARQDAPVKQFVHAMMICEALASIEIGVRDAGHEFIPLGDRRACHPMPPFYSAVQTR